MKTDAGWSDAIETVLELEASVGLTEPPKEERTFAGSGRRVGARHFRSVSNLRASGAVPLPLALAMRYSDIDTDRDGTPDTRIVGDFDEDGTLTFADIRAAYEDFEARIAATSTTTRRFILLAGTFEGTFRDFIHVRASDLEFSGLGVDETKLQITSSCNGSPGALDDGDEIESFRFFLHVHGHADRVTVQGFSFDGGSLRSLYTRLGDTDLNACNINDVNENGIGNGDDPHPGGQCTESWCPLDSHCFMYLGDETGSDFVGTDRFTLRNASFKNIDRTVLVGTFRSTNLVVANSRFENVGEHSMWMNASGARIQGNMFKYCGTSHGPCIVDTPWVTDIENQLISDNDFSECPGECIGTEMATNVIRRIQIIHNVMKWSAHPNNKAPIRFVTAGWAGNGVDQLLIRDNQITIGTDLTEQAISIQSTPPSREVTSVLVENNRINARWMGTGSETKGVLLRGVAGFTIFNNRISVEADQDLSTTNPVGLALLSSRDGLVSANLVDVKGGEPFAIYAANLDEVALDRNYLKVDSVGTSRGVRAYQVRHSTVSRNTISGGQVGFELWWNCDDNRLVANQFKGPVTCVQLNGSSSNAGNVIERNTCVAPSGEAWVDREQPALNTWRDNTATP